MRDAPGVSLADRLAAALPGPVERRETHGAWVLLWRDRALKLRKPVRYAFLDYSTPERRRAAAEQEVRVNQPLAASVYLGVRAVVERGGTPELAGPDADGAIDHVVEMRRFDERCTMASLAERGRLAAEHVEAVGRRLAAFHGRAEVCRGDAAGAFAARLAADLDELEALDAGALALRRFAAGALRAHAAELGERGRRGLRRDGHGDLRAEHVVFGDELLIVDRLEFDCALRCADVADDLSFLTMDLESLDARWAAGCVVEAYRVAGGDPGSRWLRTFFAWHRALVRAKVALLRGAGAEAEALLALAERLAWRDRGSGLVLVAGPPASGKSTLAGALGRAMELPVLSSDVTRKRLHGRRPEDRLEAPAYADEVTREVYGRLGLDARAAIANRGGAIVDATGRTRELRDVLLAEAGRARPALAVTCTADDDVRHARALARLRDPGRVSDADAVVAARLAAEFEPIDAREAFDVHVEARTDGPEDPLEVIAVALDEHRARG